MLPGVTLPDLMDSRLADAELLGENARYVAASACPNSPNVGIGQPPVAIGGWMIGTPFVDHVPHIVERRTDEQMIRAKARPNVAAMENELVTGKVEAAPDVHRNTVGTLATSPNDNNTVAILGDGARVEPTAGDGIDSAPLEQPGTDRIDLLSRGKVSAHQNLQFWCHASGGYSRAGAL